MNKVTDRTVYNLGLPATGPKLVYEQLSSSSIKQEIPNAEYVIYTFLYCHLWRQFDSIISPVRGQVNPLYFIDNKNKLKKKKQFPLFLYSSYAYLNYLEYKTCHDYLKEIKKELPLFLKTMEESVKVMKKNYPNAKFILMEFPQANMCTPDYIDKSTELTEKI